MVIGYLVYFFNTILFLLFACLSFSFLIVNTYYFMTRESNCDNQIPTRTSISKLNDEKQNEREEKEKCNEIKIREHKSSSHKCKREKIKTDQTNSKLTPGEDKQMLREKSKLKLSHQKQTSTEQNNCLDLFKYFTAGQLKLQETFRRTCMKELVDTIDSRNMRVASLFNGKMNRSQLLMMHECLRNNQSLYLIIYANLKPCLWLSFDHILLKLYSTSAETHLLIRTLTQENLVITTEQIKLSKSILNLIQSFESTNLLVCTYRNDRTIRLWDVNSKKMLDMIKSMHLACSICQLGSQLKFGVFFEDGLIQIYDISSSQFNLFKQTKIETNMLNDKNIISKMIYLGCDENNDEKLAIYRQNSLYIWKKFQRSRRQKPKLIFQTERKTKLISNFVYNKYLDQLFVCLFDEIKVFSCKTNKFLFKLSLNLNNYIKEIKILNENLFVYTILNKNGFHVFDMRSSVDINKNKMAYLTGMNKYDELMHLANKEEVYCFDYNKDLNLIYVAYRNGLILSWQLSETLNDI